jgi:hypothetical protein
MHLIFQLLVMIPNSFLGKHLTQTIQSENKMGFKWWHGTTTELSYVSKSIYNNIKRKMLWHFDSNAL